MSEKPHSHDETGQAGRGWRPSWGWIKADAPRQLGGLGVLRVLLYPVYVS